MKYDINKIPKELEKYFWLHYLSQKKYITILYDDRGRPLWAAHRNHHRENDTLESFMQGPVYSFYSLPVEDDLNALFSHYRKINQKQDPDRQFFLDPIDKLRPGDFHGLLFPNFPSKNIIEAQTVAPFIILNYPLTTIYFIRINRSRFIGMVAFPDMLADIHRAENKPAVFVDENMNIIGFNSLFAGTVSMQDPKNNMGRPLTDIITFNRPPLKHNPDNIKPNLKSFDQWYAKDKKWPFKTGKTNKDFTFTDKGLLCQNTTSENYHFLAWNNPLPVDLLHFTMDVKFFSPGGTIPNIILRGIGENTYRSRDLIGYNITNTRKGKCVFKKAGTIVRYFSIPVSPPQEECVLTIQKFYQTFTFFLNGRQCSEWQETVPFMMKGQDLIYFFIRPRETIILKSVRIRKRVINTDPFKPAVLPLRAYIKNPEKKGLQFNVSLYQSALSQTNYSLFLFEDITDLKTDIETLTQERDKLTAMIKHEQTFIGASPSIEAIRNQLKTVADSDMAVLLEGETGTGKEVLAQSIHALSPRKNKPLMKIDCSAIPGDLIESELFGHEKGAFTGAVAAHQGKFEQAQGGTIFLDEIENLPVNVQAKLLNVLEERTVVRIGGTRSIQLDIRLIAASNAQLKVLIQKGEFRSDLFYRLNHLRFELPPLRERKEDLPLLTEHFIREGNRIYNNQIKGLTKNALQKLFNARWSGNVRELRNVIFRAVLFCKTDEIEEMDIIIDEIPEKRDGTFPSTGKRRGYQKPSTLTEEEVKKALEAAGGVVAQAAKRLGISRMMTYNLIKRFGIDLGSVRAYK